MLVSVGRRPNSAGLGLEKTEVELDERGFVVTDEQQRTADPHILAIGDVAGEPMLAHKATHQGKVAVEALHGEPAAFEPLAIPAVVFTDPEIAWAGLTEEQAKAARASSVEVVRYPWAASGRAMALGRTEGMTKFLIDPETERVLGVGIVGAGAGDLIAEGVVAIEMGATARDLGESIHPHPTLSETLGNAAEAFLGSATEIYRPRTARKRSSLTTWRAGPVPCLDRPRHWRLSPLPMGRACVGANRNPLGRPTARSECQVPVVCLIAPGQARMR